mgnify:CR=1 FL=1
MFLPPFHKRRNAINPPQAGIHRPFDRFPIRFRFGAGVCNLRAGAAVRRFRFFFLLLRSQFRKTRLLSSVFPPSSVYFTVSASIFRFHRIYFLSRAFPDPRRSVLPIYAYSTISIFTSSQRMLMFSLCGVPFFGHKKHVFFIILTHFALNFKYSASHPSVIFILCIQY